SNNRGAVIGAEFVSGTNGNALYFATNGSSVSSNDTPTERMRIDSSGRVGIGDSSPSYKLDVKNTDNTTYTAGNFINNASARIHNSSTTTNSFASLAFRTASGDNAIGFQYTGTTNQADFVIVADGGANGVERMRIDSSGRLLVGTTTEGHPDADDLTLQASSGYTGITLRSGTTDGGAIYFSDGTSGTAEYDGQIVYSQNSQTMTFATATYPRLAIDSSGDVLVKTLDARIGSSVGAVEYGTSADSSVRFYQNNTERMRIDGSGQLLLGETSAGGTCKLGMSFGNAIGNYMELGGTSRIANGLNKIFI
ncbi:MAG: hypothetical protein GY845_10565, partial [Planctomycetes bacterium]|nr:hypothetical protein [Planctomycetota bacterium]